MGGVFNIEWDVGDKRFNNTVYVSRDVFSGARITTNNGSNAMGVLVKFLYEIHALGPSVLWGVEVGMGVCVYIAQFVDAIYELPDAFN